MSRILVGTCSWADKSLIDSEVFYHRKSITPEERLAFYAGQFPLVEADWCAINPHDVQPHEL